MTDPGPVVERMLDRLSDRVIDLEAQLRAHRTAAMDVQAVAQMWASVRQVDESMVEIMRNQWPGFAAALDRLADGGGPG